MHTRHHPRAAQAAHVRNFRRTPPLTAGAALEAQDARKWAFLIECYERMPHEERRRFWQQHSQASKVMALLRFSGPAEEGTRPQ